MKDNLRTLSLYFTACTVPHNARSFFSRLLPIKTHFWNFRIHTSYMWVIVGVLVLHCSHPQIVVPRKSRKISGPTTFPTIFYILRPSNRHTTLRKVDKQISFQQFKTMLETSPVLIQLWFTVTPTWLLPLIINKNINVSTFTQQYLVQFT